MALWTLPALAAAFFLAPFIRLTSMPSTLSDARPALGRHGLAWQVTDFMGLQSSLAYILSGCLPTLLQSRGQSAIDAG